MSPCGTFSYIASYVVESSVKYVTNYPLESSVINKSVKWFNYVCHNHPVESLATEQVSVLRELSQATIHPVEVSA